MNQFEVYSHPDFQGTITNDNQFDTPCSDKAFVYHIKRMQWYQTAPSWNLYRWTANALSNIKEGKVFWLGHCKDREEAVALYESVDRDDLDILAFFDGYVYILKGD